MLGSWFKKLLNKKNNDINNIVDARVEETRQEVNNVDIDIVYDGIFSIVDIKEDCNLEEYLNIVTVLDPSNLVNQKVNNSALLDEQLYFIKKKKIYVFDIDNIEYNVFSNESEIFIDERVKYDDDDFYIDEHSIRINKDSGHFAIHRLKHRKSLSTFYVKFFLSDKPDYEFFHLDESKALQMAEEILNNLSNVEGIERVIDLLQIQECLTKWKTERSVSSLNNCVLSGEDESVNQKVKQKIFENN